MTHDASPGRARAARLSALLQAAADDLQRTEPPPELGRSLLAQFQALHRAEPAPATASAGPTAGKPGGHTRPGRPVWPSGRWLVPALLLVGLAMGWLLVTRHGARGGPVPPPPVAPMLKLPPGMAILPLDGDTWPRLAQADGAVAWLVDTELPQERLALLGLPFDPSRAGERVPAELLLTAEGELLAVRLLR